MSDATASMRGSVLRPRLVELRGGTPVVIRPITTADTAGITTYLEALSDRSRYLRFLQAPAGVPARLLRMFTAPDSNRLVMVAVTDGVIVGEAMLATDRAGAPSADIALSVAESVRRRGLARLMLGVLLELAEQRDILWVRADILAENQASVALMRTLGASMWFEDGQLVARLDVPSAQHTPAA